MSATPRVGTLSGTILWGAPSGGSLFNGFAEVVLIVPTTAGTGWPSLRLEPGYPQKRVPLWTRIPINEGQFQNIGLWYNEDISPPNSKYAIYYYDSAGVLIGAPGSISDAFTISSSTTEPPIYINNAAVAGTSIPSPV